MALTQITEKGIKDGEIINADINASAAIAGSKLNPVGLANVGIGVTDVKAALQVNSNKNAETDRHDGSNYHLFLRNPADDTGEACGLAFSVTSNATKTGAAIMHERVGGGSQGGLQFYTNGDGNSVSQRMVIDSSGNVGIGTSPANKLHVEGSASGVIVAKQTTNNGGFNTFEGKASGGTTTFYASHNGRVGAAGGIIFGSDTAAANILDDYEEGDWTPQMWRNGGSNEITLGSGNRYGRYIKIGDLLWISFYWYNNSITDNAGQYWVVRNLPFNLITGNTGAYQFIGGGYLYMAGANSGDYAAGGQYRWQANGTFAANTLTLYSNPNNTNPNGQLEFSGCGVLRVA